MTGKNSIWSSFNHSFIWSGSMNIQYLNVYVLQVELWFGWLLMCCFSLRNLVSELLLNFPHTCSYLKIKHVHVLGVVLNPFSPCTLFSGDVESAVEVLEEVYTSPDSKSPSMIFVFRKVLEEGNDKALDKCKRHMQSIHAPNKEIQNMRPQVIADLK